MKKNALAGWAAASMILASPACDSRTAATQQTCIPTTCTTEGKDCGTLSDGCGGTISCGACTLPGTCGGSGVDNVCGAIAETCTPTTCEAQGTDCGNIADGCDGTLFCGSCETGETCGGGDAANVCGTGTCTATTCDAQGKNCGTISDGCDDTLDCGDCTKPDTCGGGGEDNICGCTPTTCAAQGAGCGSISDGCGSTVECGTCEDGTCVNNACATGCDAPEDFSFFVMSLEAILELSGTTLSGDQGAAGFGGDLGGLSGADQKCQVVAESRGSCGKVWHAFLSVTDSDSSDSVTTPVNAIDRVGTGPWHDYNGYLVAENTYGLLHNASLNDTRPDGDTDIVWTDDWGTEWPFNQCLTNEFGICVHDYGDSHDTLTGSDTNGELYSTDMKYTCNDWTSADVDVQLPIGHTWPRRLNGTDAGEAHWIQSHTICSQGGGPGGPGGPGGSAGSTSCNGCGAYINLSDSMEEGVGGDGGYGAWYCFAVVCDGAYGQAECD